MRNSLQNIYESMLLNEVAGAINYWLTPTGELIKINDQDTHVSYAKKHFNIDNWPTYNRGVDWKEIESDQYNTVYNLGYVRVVEQPASIYFTYNRSNLPNKSQANELLNLATDKQKNLVDGETQKVLIRNNEIEPDVARNDNLDKMEKELKPSFYKKRKDYGEGFSKIDLQDYTKLIYEYNMNEREFYDDDSDFGSYRKGIVIPKELPDKVDYRQNLIDDAIEYLQNVKMHDPDALNDAIDYWESLMNDKNFTEDEIRKVIEMGLGDWDFRDF